MTVVAIAAGGTGGHIIPGVAVARALLGRGAVITWLGTGSPLEERLLAGLDCARFTLPVIAPRGGIPGLLSASRSLLTALHRTLGCLRRNRPGVVLGMGGFASWPGGLAARLLRIPLILHEQNAVPGLANRVLAPLATGVCTGFPGVFPGRPAGRVSHTGNPVPAAIAALGERPSDSADTPGLRVLVLGGSQGAEALNRTVPPALALAARAGVALTVTHHSGAADGDRVAGAYARFAVDARVMPFIDDMAAAYADANLVIARAGALTVAEICAAGRAAVLIPYPHATDDHQSANAAVLAQRDAAILLPQVDLNEGGLASLVADLASGPRRAALARNAASLAMPGAAEVVANRCLQVARDA